MKSFLLVCTLLLATVSASAQGNFNADEVYSRMASRLAKNMKLESNVETEFTALYVEYQKARRVAASIAGEAIEGRRQNNDLENITDEKATELIENSFKAQEAQLAIDREYYAKFIRVITPAQAAQIYVRRGGMMGGQQRQGNFRQRQGGFGVPGGNGPDGGFGGDNF